MFIFCSKMNAAAVTPPPASPDPAGDRTRALLERQVERLERMAEAGMEMIEALVAQAKGSGPQVVEGDVGLAFSRVSRAVRLSILLQEQLIEGNGAPSNTSDESPAGAAAPDETTLEPDNRERAVRVVRRVARDHCRREGFEVSAIVREAAERLNDDDIYGLVASRPVGELVALICRDFGLEPNWDALASEAWAKAEMASGAEGSPFLDDEFWEDEPEGEPDPGPSHPALRTRTLKDTLRDLARDPDVLAAARRDTG
jgi:hypothetical protein